jgi:hypothetical protein
MKKLGYDNNIAPPINPAVQATLSKITSTEIHRVVQHHEKKAAKGESPGQKLLCLQVMGIQEWSKVFSVFLDEGEEKALVFLVNLLKDLEKISDGDSTATLKARGNAKRIQQAITLKDTRSTPEPASLLISSAAEIAARVRRNKKILMKVIILRRN